MKDCFCFSFPSFCSASPGCGKRPWTVEETPNYQPLSSLPFKDFLSHSFCQITDKFKFMLPGKCPAKHLLGIIRYQNKAQRWCIKASRSTPQFWVPLPWLVKKREQLLTPARCCLFLKWIVFHPCHRSKWMLLKWWLRTEVQQERSTVRWNSFQAWVSSNGDLIYCLT